MMSKYVRFWMSRKSSVYGADNPRRTVAGQRIALPLLTSDSVAATLSFNHLNENHPVFCVNYLRE